MDRQRSRSVSRSPRNRQSKRRRSPSRSVSRSRSPYSLRSSSPSVDSNNDRRSRDWDRGRDSRRQNRVLSDDRRRSAAREDDSRRRSRNRDAYRRDRDRGGDADERRSRHARDESRERKRRHRQRSPNTGSDRSADSDVAPERSKRSKKAKKSKKRETSEERRLRKAERKAEKALLKQELLVQKESQIAAQMSATLGYSNAENPFGDSNLNQKFVWVKKREIDAKQGITASERLEKEMRRKQEMAAELEKLKKRRAEREIEQQLREQEQLRLQREQDAMAVGEWIAKEDDFQLDQAKIRAQIRVKEGRARPIDVLAINLSISSDSKLAQEFDALGLEMDINEPYFIFKNLQLREIEELHSDIQMYLGLEKDPENKKFWEAMLVVCDDELVKQRLKTETSARGRQGASADAPRTGVSESVSKEIDRMLEPKSLAELVHLQRQIEDKLSSGAPVDVDYWEATLKAIVIWKAKAHLREMHAQMLRQRIQILRTRQQAEGPKIAESGDGAAGESSGVVHRPITFETVSSRSHQKPSRYDSSAGIDGESAPLEQIEEYDPSMSPQLYESIEREDENLEVIGEADDMRRLQEARRAVAEKYNIAIPSQSEAAAPATDTSVLIKIAETEMATQDFAEQAFMQEASKNMSSDEIVMSDEATISKTTYMWQDKYRPRKPRYFNRVHTGYEWNKYNQTHYDTSNPPPKVVQGYKFNIFYPDLIDKSKAPTYRIEADPLSDDTVILRFIAGPPYEDIAFRIVKREWEYSHKRGFRSSFDRGILQLWFHFRRAFYRR